MKTNTSNAAYTLQFEEILFANKNKNYGAFVIRRSYNRNLMIACSAAIIMIIGIALTQRQKPIALQTNFKTDTGVTIDLGPAPINEKIIIPEKVNIQPLQTTVRFTPPVVVEDSKAANEYIPTVEDLKEATPWIKTMEGQEGGVDVTYIEPVIPVDRPKEAEVEAPFNYAEEMPAYAEGLDALMKFFASKIRYPELARKAGIEGKVHIGFIVNRDGTISNPEVLKGIGGGCDEEALRVVSLLGKWIPGKQNGKAVRIKMSIPIVFKLQ
jgi:periplasmic protein TonB